MENSGILAERVDKTVEDLGIFNVGDDIESERSILFR